MTDDTHNASGAAVLKLLASSDRPATFKLNPSSDLLAKIQSFLPEMEAANRALEGIPQHELDIEAVEDGMRHIEMNVELYREEEAKRGMEEDDEDEDDDEDDEEIVIVKSPELERKGLIVEMEVDR